MKSKGIFAAASLAVFVCALLLWRLAILAFGIAPFMLPTPAAVGKAIAVHLPDLWSATLLSAEAAVGGLVASIVVGVLIALIFARLDWVRRLVFPYTVMLQTVPIVAVAPLIIVWFGPGMLSVGVISFIICLAPIIANTTQGLVSVDENLVQLFLMHNATQGQIVRRLRLPHALPHFFLGARIASGIAVIGAITGELFAGSGQVGHGGIGYSILYAQTQGQVDLLFAYVIAATVLGFSLLFTVMFFEWMMLHKWHDAATAGRIEV
jgi:NitT/TauT family transport system permease protein